jgi:hypothetical protein
MTFKLIAVGLICLIVGFGIGFGIGFSPMVDNQELYEDHQELEKNYNDLSGRD